MELVLVVDNEEVSMGWGKPVPVFLLSSTAARRSKPAWKCLYVLPIVQEAQGLAHSAEPHEGNREPCGQGEPGGLDLPSPLPHVRHSASVGMNVAEERFLWVW